jgi:hypothetical protein
VYLDGGTQHVESVEQVPSSRPREPKCYVKLLARAQTGIDFSLEKDNYGQTDDFLLPRPKWSPGVVMHTSVPVGFLGSKVLTTGRWYHIVGECRAEAVRRW